MKKKKKTIKKRLEIRVSDVPQDLYDSIKENAKKECRTMGKEVLSSIKCMY